MPNFQEIWTVGNSPNCQDFGYQSWRVGPATADTSTEFRCERATGWAGTAQNVSKNEKISGYFDFFQELPGLPVPNLRGVRGTPRGVRPPTFGAKGPLVGPGQPRTSKKMRIFPDISTFCQELSGLPVPNLRGVRETPRGVRPPNFGAKGPLD